MSISKYIKAIPSALGLTTDPELQKIFARVKETIDLREGRKSSLPLEQTATFQNLIDLGLVTQADIDNKVS